jgi:uncharacterized protein (DUF4415 family)
MRKQPDDKPLTTQELAALPDTEINYSDIPELDEAFWRNAAVVMPDKTEPVTLRVKKSVLNAYKATGKGYQTRMNAVLETYALAQLNLGKQRANLELTLDDLRSIVAEALKGGDSREKVSDLLKAAKAHVAEAGSPDGDSNG